ncbi:MAG: NADH:ubiquinone oxidoreductase subunit NDUFA12 [Pseudomonadota bacterium]
MSSLILQFFTWWNGQTWGTRYYTWRNGVKVGEDSQGNVYYRNADDTRRWIIYNGPVEASRIPSGWHGWMHHKVKAAPSEQNYAKREWELPHLANPTGTAHARLPDSSLLKPDPKVAQDADYEAWRP